MGTGTVSYTHLPFREALLTGNTKMRMAYGIRSSQIHGSIQTADDVPAKRIDLKDIILPISKEPMDKLMNDIR